MEIWARKETMKKDLEALLSEDKLKNLYWLLIIQDTPYGKIGTAYGFENLHNLKMKEEVLISLSAKNRWKVKNLGKSDTETLKDYFDNMKVPLAFIGIV